MRCRFFCFGPCATHPPLPLLQRQAPRTVALQRRSSRHAVSTHQPRAPWIRQPQPQRPRRVEPSPAGTRRQRQFALRAAEPWIRKPAPRICPAGAANHRLPGSRQSRPGERTSGRQTNGQRRQILGHPHVGEAKGRPTTAAGARPGQNLRRKIADNLTPRPDDLSSVRNSGGLRHPAEKVSGFLGVGAGTKGDWSRRAHSLSKPVMVQAPAL